MNNSTKWSQEMRRFVYTSLLITFGELSTWKSKTTPGNGKSELYDSTLKKITNHLNEHHLPKGKTPITISAVKNQIHWAIQRQSEIKTRGYHYNYILNTAAALEVGFMKSTDEFFN